MSVSCLSLSLVSATVSVRMASRDTSSLVFSGPPDELQTCLYVVHLHKSARPFRLFPRSETNSASTQGAAAGATDHAAPPVSPSELDQGNDYTRSRRIDRLQCQ